jgi:hypothetical protein
MGYREHVLPEKILWNIVAAPAHCAFEMSVSEVDNLVPFCLIFERAAGLCSRESIFLCLGAGFDADVCVGNGGTSRDDLELLGRDTVDPKDDFFGLGRVIPNRLCSFLRELGGFGVIDCEGTCVSTPGASGDTMMAAIGRAFALGVPCVTVAFVAVVVEDRGREGMRVGGFESGNAGSLDAS